MASEQVPVEASELPHVDGTRMLVPAGWTGTVDVAFDGRRVFSFDPRRHPEQPGGYRIVSWPVQFRPYLRGSTELTFRGHGGDEPFAVLELAFDDAPHRVDLVDDEGHPLAADKWGRLSRTFESLGADFAELLLDDVLDLIADVTDVLGVPAFIAYGTLLGAVREGGFIGHDTDADIAYLSACTDLADLAHESYTLQRGLLAKGWSIHRSSTAFLQVWRGEDVDESRRIDIFTAYYLAGVFTLDFAVRGQLAPEAIVPLGEVVLAGRTMPAPADPDALLALTYGPSWHTPEPAFKFPTPRSTAARTAAFFGRPVVREAISVPAELAPPLPTEPLRPSDFARWVDAVAPAGATVVDVRAGVGHDATWLADQGRVVRGLDVKENTRSHHADRPELADRLRFGRLPVHDLRQTIACGARLAAEPGVRVLAGHRVLDGLRHSGRTGFWVLARMLLDGGGLLLLETADDGLVDEVSTGVQRSGGAVQAVEPVPGSDGQPDVVRVTAQWPATAPA